MTDNSESSADLEAAIDRLIETRGGKELLSPEYTDSLVPINDFVYRSVGFSASHMLVTDAGRVIINAGMGFEAPQHKRLYDAVCPGPTPYIITTQAHVDHVGGVGLFREPGTVYVAHANNPACQHDDTRIGGFRMSGASVWFKLGPMIEALMAKNPGVPITQDIPTPDLMFTDRLELRVGGLDIELISAPGGETVDSIIVWLPQHRIAFISNLLGPLFPHFPNFNTVRGDKYRFPEAYLASVRTLRALQPELLITGRAEPIAGAAFIDACLGRLHGAVDYVHRATLNGINAQADINTLMREITLPPELRVGQGYGKVSWCVRTIWDLYIGWFRQESTTELYPDESAGALDELVALTSLDAVAARARARLGDGQPVLAIHLAEAVLRGDADHAAGRSVMADARGAARQRRRRELLGERLAARSARPIRIAGTASARRPSNAVTSSGFRMSARSHWRK